MTEPESTVRRRSEVTVQAHPRSQFDADDFRESTDQFKDVIVLPLSVFEALFGTERTTGYVRLSSRGHDEEIAAYALQFSEAYDSNGIGVPKVYLRDTLRQRLDTERSEPELDVSPIDTPDTGPLRVVRFSTAAESTEPTTCRMHPDTLSAIRRSDGDTVELYNPKRGYRFVATVRSERALGPGEISLSTRARKLLDAEYPERASETKTTTLHARQPVVCQESRRTLLDRVRSAGRVLLDRAVNYNKTQLRVVIGLNADEGRGTGRVNEDTMEILAVSEGDRVIIEAKETQTSALLRQIDPDSHLIETDEDITSDDVRNRTILLPSTVRQDIDAVCGDVVSVRRDTRHIAIHQVTVSVFAFIGTFVGGLQTVDLFVPPQYQLYGLLSTLVLCLGAVWLLLWPERERCR